jgi:hypothetical protein
MSTNAGTAQIDRYTQIGALGEKVRAVVSRFILPIAAVLALESIYLTYTSAPGAYAFALIGLGTWITLWGWSSGGIGLPLVPMIAVQNLFIYGGPIVNSHENILNYRPEFVLKAGTEVLLFDVLMVVGWRVGMQLFRPSPPISHTFHEFNRAGIKGWIKIGFTLILSALFVQVLQGLNLLDAVYSVLPSGADSIINALLSVASACGFFLVSMVVGSREISPVERIAFWLLLFVTALISAASLQLAGAAAYLISVTVGLFWSNGRLPWRYLTVAMLSLAFLNLGKTGMRARYWSDEEQRDSNVSMTQLPQRFQDWVQFSSDALVANREINKASPTGASEESQRNQTLLDRIDNLQNMLFVIDAVEVGHIKPLGGATYTLIPPLLVPRILWPNKPRSHEGQIMLNVHFGRQDLDSTFMTYIAWGLLPEAYGNFGPYFGSISLGFALGIFFAFVENVTAKKLVISMEGFLSLSLLMNLMNSFEMVASVLVTSIFQSYIVIVAASLPFVHRMVVQRPENDDA